MAKYIDRDKILDRLDDLSYIATNPPMDIKDQIGWELLRGLHKEISEMPTAEVEEVKHGEWKVHPDGSGTCSCCNRTQKAVWDYDNKQNFCGRCGADMRGGKNDL